MEKFQERLRQCRIDAGLTQESAAQKMGIIHRSYTRYECGESLPSLATAVKIADYFNVSLDYLAGRTDEP